MSARWWASRPVPRKRASCCPIPKAVWRPGLPVNIELTAGEVEVPVAVSAEAIQTVRDRHGALGVYSYQKLPIDAVPDITNVQVQINTEAPGYSPLEAEQRITFPIETAMAGLPGSSYTRSLSRYGLSQVTVVFEDGTDIYFARQLVNERMQEAKRRSCPPGSSPSWARSPPVSARSSCSRSSRGRAREARTAPPGRRPICATMQDWVIKPQLRNVPGVTEVNTIGGYVKEFHVTPRSDKLVAYGLTCDDRAGRDRPQQCQRRRRLHRAQRRAVSDPRAGPGRDIEDIAGHRRRPPRRRPDPDRDVAEVGLGKELRTGAATENGREVVLGTVFMLIGENSRDVSRRRRALEEINRSLPPGVSREDRLRPHRSGRQAPSPRSEEPARRRLLVIAILFLLLGNIRAALITAAGDSAGDAVHLHRHGQQQGQRNLMSLGALDFGIIVDGAVVIVENCLRRLRHGPPDSGDPHRRERFRGRFADATRRGRKRPSCSACSSSWSSTCRSSR
jgi:cobalt-zinc-cadmium resistance protein CzcA